MAAEKCPSCGYQWHTAPSAEPAPAPQCPRCDAAVEAARMFQQASQRKGLALEEIAALPLGDHRAKKIAQSAIGQPTAAPEGREKFDVIRDIERDWPYGNLAMLRSFLNAAYSAGQASAVEREKVLREALRCISEAYVHSSYDSGKVISASYKDQARAALAEGGSDGK